MTILKHLKRDMRQASKAMDRAWDRFDNNPDENKPYPDVFLFGSAMNLVSSQIRYIEELESRLRLALENEWSPECGSDLSEIVKEISDES